ncbi:MAG: DUF3787 domain-containing protein [Tissierellia bacterium]|nr:DUF3787 domain-containing protein [Tissierellia bacterium]
MNKDKKQIKKASNPDPCKAYQQHKEPKTEDTDTDIYYKTKKKLPDSKVAIPTEDSVIEAKEWVDDVNRK